MAKKKNKPAENATIDFEKLSLQECHFIYPALLDNAERHLIIAENIAEHDEEYGIATTHLIIAAEEYMKALSVHLIGWGVPVSFFQKVLHLFGFSNDDYLISPGTIVMGIYIKSLYTVFESATKGVLTLNWLQLKKVFEQNLNPLSLIKQANRYALWWSKAKRIKNKGFYITYQVEMTTPDHITPEDYEQTLDIVDEIKEVCLSTVSFTQKMPEKQRRTFLKWMKKYFEPLMRLLSKPLQYLGL